MHEFSQIRTRSACASSVVQGIALPSLGTARHLVDPLKTSLRHPDGHATGRKREFTMRHLCKLVSIRGLNNYYVDIRVNIYIIAYVLTIFIPERDE